MSADRVTVGAGSVGLLQQLALSYLDRGDHVAFCWPSFEAYPQFAGLVEAHADHPAAAAADVRSDALADAVTADTKMVLIANPNNPTGTIVGTDELAALVERVPDSCLVVVDEAYAEFVTDPRVTDSMALLDRFPNVLVLRTFSKAHALAALRIGYAVGHPDVIAVLDRTLVPFVVNGLGQQAAIASLAAVDEMRERVAVVVAERASVAAALRRSGWGVPEPQGNFVWLPAGAASADVGVGAGAARRGDAGVPRRRHPGDDRRCRRQRPVPRRVREGGRRRRRRRRGSSRPVTSPFASPTHLDELDARARLVSRRTPRRRCPTGLTEPDAGGTEQWDAGQVWAHLAEFGSYWRAELRAIVDSPVGDGGPVPFGRTKRDPHRIADDRRSTGTNRSADQFETVRRDIAAFRADLAELTPADWARRGRHETLGEMDLWRFLDHFVTGHYAEHADQLDALRAGSPHG